MPLDGRVTVSLRKSIGGFNNKVAPPLDFHDPRKSRQIEAPGHLLAFTF